MSHTPGPWTVETVQNREWSPTLVVAPQNHGVLIADCGLTLLVPREKQIANARLIAAAPDLLEALTAIDNAATYGEDAADIVADVQRLCRAAIAKATGGAQ